MSKANPKEKFDLQTHVRDAKGNIVKVQPYRLTIINGVHEYERPPGSGWVYTAGNDLIRKPSDKQIKAQEAQEFSNDELKKQIQDLQDQLKSQASFVKLEEDDAEISAPIDAEVAEINEAAIKAAVVERVANKFIKPNHVK